MIHWHKYEEIKKEVVYKDDLGYRVNKGNPFLKKVQTYIHKRCTVCGKRETRVEKGDWT